MMWMRNEAEVLGSSEVAMGRKKESVQVYARCTQAERSDSIVPPDSEKRAFSLSLKQNVSTITMENSKNKAKYSK